MPGYLNMAPWGGRGFGRGFGRGRGFGGGGGGWGGGWGWRNRYYATGAPQWASGWWGPSPAPEHEHEWLAEHAKALEREIEEVRARLAELESKPSRDT